MWYSMRTEEDNEMRKEINPTLIGQRVKTRRRQLHMTQDELAAKLGYTSKATISKYEKGEIKLDLETFYEILKNYLKMSLAK